MLDVRCLPNPFYVPELKHKTGLDQEVVDFVMGHPEAQELLKRYESFLEYALPLYVKEGKSQLTIAVGCTGGKRGRRSPAAAYRRTAASVPLPTASPALPSILTPAGWCFRRSRS